MHCLYCFRWCVILNLLRGFVINKRFKENTLMLNFIDYISLLCNKEGTEEITIAKICITQNLNTLIKILKDTITCLLKIYYYNQKQNLHLFC